MILGSTPLAALAADLAAGKSTSRELVEAAIAAIEDASGEGARAFIHLNAERARTEADASDRLRAAGVVPSPLAGLPISIKDLFDVAGEVTSAASKTLADRPPSARDSAVVARLRAAGAVPIGRTNLTEFAYSGIGINPNFGTPKNPWDRARGRIPGGSSAGAAVSVTDGMAAAAIGTDTGGSVRIPAALCGITGFKTTTGRIPLDGVFPLSATLDSAGPLAPTVACCAVLDAIMAGRDAHAAPGPFPVKGLRLAVAKTLVQDGMDDTVGAAFQGALAALSAAGALIEDVSLAPFAEIPALSVHGGILGAEAYALHRARLAERGEMVDPRVKVRIERGINISSADLLDILAARADICARVDAITADYDAVLMPTVAMIAPPIADIIASEDLYAELNPFMLRNTTVGNFLDRCALTLPIHAPGEAPVGLTVMDHTGADDHLIRLGLGIETVVGRLPSLVSRPRSSLYHACGHPGR